MLQTLPVLYIYILVFWYNKNHPRDYTDPELPDWYHFICTACLETTASVLKNIPGLDRNIWSGTPDSLWKLLLISKHHCNNRTISIHSASVLKILMYTVVVILVSVEVELLYYLTNTHVEVSEHGRPYMNVDSL